MNKNLQQIIENSGEDEAMVKACEANVFWVVAIPCMNNTYSIGTADEEMPNLLATKEEAEAENQEMIDMYAEQIKEGERDADDEWEGEVLEARWNGEASEIELYLDGSHIHSEDWKQMAGL